MMASLSGGRAEARAVVEDAKDRRLWADLGGAVRQQDLHCLGRLALASMVCVLALTQQVWQVFGRLVSEG